jgi:hypothetical protein
MIKIRHGVGPSVACIMILGMLSACSAKQEKRQSQAAEIQEVRALVQATRQHPSVVDQADHAGPPIHVDPFPRSAGHRHHTMAGAAQPKTHA